MLPIFFNVFLTYRYELVLAYKGVIINHKQMSQVVAEAY